MELTLRDKKEELDDGYKFKDDRSEPVIDLQADELEILKRYDTALRTFVNRRHFSLLKKPFTESDIGKNIQSTVVDFSVAHAMQGAAYIDELQMNMQYTLLEAALILTITLPLYINPPVFQYESLEHVFSAVVGFAACNHLGVIIACAIITGLLNCAYTEADTLIARVLFKLPLIVVFNVNYIAILATLAAMLIAGFCRSLIDGAVQLYAVVVVVSLIALLICGVFAGIDLQDQRVFQFYKKYCDENGELKDEYLKMVYEGDDASNTSAATPSGSSRK